MLARALRNTASDAVHRLPAMIAGFFQGEGRMFRFLGVLVTGMILLTGCDSAADREAAAQEQRIKEYKARKKADYEHDRKLLESLSSQNK